MGAVAGKKLEPVKCGLCDFNSKRITSVERHIEEIHGRSAQQLYDELNSGPTLCKCGCGEQTKWSNWKNGYATFLLGHNANIYASYSEEEAKRIATTRGSNWRNKPSWSKGLTKDTDERVANRGIATSVGRKKAFDEGHIHAWSKGLTKDTDDRVANAATSLKTMFAEGELVPWAKGLTKDTDDRIKNMALKVSLTHQKTSLRNKLDAQKRLKDDEIKQRVEASGKLTLVENANAYINDKTPTIRVKCKTCNNEWIGTLRRLQYGRCFYCDPGGSVAQHEVKAWIQSLGVDVDSNRRDVIDGLELDIFIPSKNVAIEYNGLYWHSLLHKGSTYHDGKSQRCCDKNITLFHIFEDEWRDKRHIVESMIKHKLGLTTHKTSARKCNVVELTTSQRRDFFNENHIDGDTNAKHAFGLLHGGEIISAMSLRQPFHKKHNSSLEVARFCNKINTSVAGGLSKLTEAARKKAESEGICNLLTYVDARLGVRGSWDSSGWRQIGSTPPRFWWTDFENRFNRFKFKADKTRGLSEAQVAVEANVVKIYGCKNITYELNARTA